MVVILKDDDKQRQFHVTFRTAMKDVKFSHLQKNDAAICFRNIGFSSGTPPQKT